jgi:hypothetical protein
MVQKLSVRCPTCLGKGKLWLRGADYLECPGCEARGTIEMQQHRVQAPTRTVYIPGLRPHVETTLQRSLLADIQIARKV